jgi:hypothetical protein
MGAKVDSRKNGYCQAEYVLRWVQPRRREDDTLIFEVAHKESDL